MSTNISFNHSNVSSAVNIKNKVALITGAGSGIGRACANLFAQEGAIVIVADIDERLGKEVASEISARGFIADFIKLDVTDESSWLNAYKFVQEKHSRLNILVNNAGIVFDLPIMGKTIEQWERTFGVNLFGVFLCTKYAVPHMKGRSGASIVNISSTNCINTPDPTSADYDASKAGVISLTKNFAQELAPEIRVNSVAPGWIDTDINKDLPEDYICFRKI